MKNQSPDRCDWERALRESQLRFASIIEGANVGTWEWNVVTGETVFNERWAQIAGYTLQELEPVSIETWIKLVHPDDLEKSNALLKRHFDGELDFYECEARLRHKNGQWVWVTDRGRVITRTPEGQPWLMYGTHSDINRRKQAESALHAQLDFNSRILNSVDGNIAVLDRDSFITTVNSAWRRFAMENDAGPESRWGIGANYLDVCNNDAVGDMDVGKTVAGIRMVQQGAHERFEMEYPCHSPTTKRWFKMIVSPLIGSPGSVLIAHSDITKSKQDHAALLEMEKRLAMAQKMEAIGTLASGIAHDFNNILWPIMGLAELLLEDLPQGDSSHHYVSEILSAASRATDLVNQILAFSRQPETLNLPIRLQPILKEVIKLCRATIPTVIDLDSDISQTCGPVVADPTQIHQIAVNLITNAYHAVDTNAGKIHLSLQETILEGNPSSRHLAAGGYAVLTVTDTGEGIDADLLDVIFDPYFTTKPQGKGTGLGLATVRKIVRGYQGDVLVSSQKGHGSKFTIFLPLANRDEKHDRDRPQESVVGGDERILLIDDEILIVQVQMELLQRLGYEVTTQSNAVAALAEFKQAPQDYDLVITDMNMPGMAGDQLAIELLAVRPTIPIILCTGCSDNIDVQRAQAIGIKAFKKKPIRAADMAQTVRNLLDDAATKNPG